MWRRAVLKARFPEQPRILSDDRAAPAAVFSRIHMTQNSSDLVSVFGGDSQNRELSRRQKRRNPLCFGRGYRAHGRLRFGAQQIYRAPAAVFSRIHMTQNSSDLVSVFGGNGHSGFAAEAVCSEIFTYNAPPAAIFFNALKLRLRVRTRIFCTSPPPLRYRT